MSNSQINYSVISKDTAEQLSYLRIYKTLLEENVNYSLIYALLDYRFHLSITHEDFVTVTQSPYCVFGKDEIGKILNLSTKTVERALAYFKAKNLISYKKGYNGKYLVYCHVKDGLGAFYKLPSYLFSTRGNLSSNELLVGAVIYSLASDSKRSGSILVLHKSREYIAKCCSLSKKIICSTIRSLCEKHFLTERKIGIRISSLLYPMVSDDAASRLGLYTLYATGDEELHERELNIDFWKTKKQISTTRKDVPGPQPDKKIPYEDKSTPLNKYTDTPYGVNNIQTLSNTLSNNLKIESFKTEFCKLFNSAKNTSDKACMSRIVAKHDSDISSDDMYQLFKFVEESLINGLSYSYLEMPVEQYANMVLKAFDSKYYLHIAKKIANTILSDKVCNKKAYLSAMIRNSLKDYFIRNIDGSNHRKMMAEVRCGLQWQVTHNHLYRHVMY